MIENKTFKTSFHSSVVSHSFNR